MNLAPNGFINGRFLLDKGLQKLTNHGSTWVNKQFRKDTQANEHCFYDRNRLKIVGAIYPRDLPVPRWWLSLMRLTAYKQEAFIHGRNSSLLIMYIILNLSTEQNGLDKHTSRLLRKWKRYITQKHRPWMVTTQSRNGKLILLAYPRASKEIYTYKLFNSYQLILLTETPKYENSITIQM